MSDDKDDVDGSDWLSSQFNPTDQVPRQTRRQPVAPPPNAEPVFGTAPTRQVPPPAAPPTATSVPAPTTTPAAPPAPPAAAPPVQNAAGGFNWGLRAGGGPDVAPAAPPPLVAPPAPAPTAPYVASVPPVAPASEPTQPLSWTDFAATQSPSVTQSPPATQNPPSTPAAYVDQPTQAFTVPSWQPAATPTESLAPAAHDNYREHSGEPTSAIDSLFGDHQFQEYEEVGVLAAVQAPPVAGARSANRPPRAPLAKSQKVLMGVAGGLIAVLLLFGLYEVGEHLGAASAAQVAAGQTGTKGTPTPAGNGGLASPGVQQWSALQGGECIQPFSSAWANTFTVVACTNNHDAQMVFKGRLSGADDTSYPSTSQFQTQLTALCSAPTAIDYKAASSVTDLQVSFSYPPSSASWNAGNRTYYCFVDRASGGALPSDLSVPAAAN